MCKGPLSYCKATLGIIQSSYSQTTPYGPYSMAMIRDRCACINRILRLREVDSEFNAAYDGPKSSLEVKAPVKVNIPRPSMRAKGQANDELECFIVNEKKFEHRIVFTAGNSVT